MGLLTIIKKQKLKDKEIRTLILGLDNSGKSTIVNKLLPKDEQSSEIMPTVGFQIHTVEYCCPNSNKYVISLWDVGGQTTLRPFWDNYFDKTDILVWCVDISLPVRFHESLKELKSFILRDEDRIGYDCQVIVALNKVDLVPINDLAIVVDDVKNDITATLGTTTVRFIECSGITGQGVSDIMAAFTVEKERDTNMLDSV